MKKDTPPFTKNEVIKASNVTILRIIEKKNNIGDTTYWVKMHCCNNERKMTHLAIVKRGYDACEKCSKCMANNRPQHIAGESGYRDRRKHALNQRFSCSPEWLVPASVKWFDYKY